MIDNSSLEQLFEIVAESRERNASANPGLYTAGVTDDEKEQVRRWADGTELKHLTNQPGYEILINKIIKYMDNTNTVSIGTDPAKTDEVLAAHAIAHAIHAFYQWLVRDVNLDILASETVPEIVREGARISKGIPVPA